MKKKILIGGIILVIILTIVASFLTNKTSPASNLPAPSPTLAPPAPTSIFIQPKNVSFSFVTTPIIPATLPTYSFIPASLTTVEQMANTAAEALNLTATPSTLINGSSYAKTWSRPNEASLVVAQTGSAITIKFDQSKSSQTPGTFSPNIAVQQFLLSLIPSTQNLSLKPNGTSNGPFDGLLILDTPAPTSLTNYFYSYMTGSYPLLTTDLDISPIAIIVDGGGVIRSANIVPPPSSIQIGNPIALLTTDQVLSSLAAGRGTILNASGAESPDQGAVPNFSKFVIKTGQIVYAPQGNLLLPGMFITGTGTATNGTTQDATIFLWLVPESSLLQP